MAAVFGFYLYHSVLADTAPQANILDPLLTPVTSFQHIVHARSLMSFVSYHERYEISIILKLRMLDPKSVQPRVICPLLVHPINYDFACWQ